MMSQDAKKYRALIQKIALALICVRLLILIFGEISALLDMVMVSKFGGGELVDITQWIVRCITYVASFILPAFMLKSSLKHLDDGSDDMLDGGEKWNGKKTFFAIGFSLGAITIATYLNYYLLSFILPSYSEFAKEALWAVELDKPYKIVFFALYSAIIPAIVEEILFRGVICKSLSPYGKGSAIIISSVLFSLIHANIEQILYAFVAGILLSLLYLKTKSLLAPMILHFVNNAIGVLLQVIMTRLGESAYTRAEIVVNALILVFMLISIFFISDEFKKREDENVALSKGEKIKGFFSPIMILFIIFSLFTMILLIIFSNF